MSIMKKPKAETYTLMFEWVTCEPDPVQYKPNKPVFSPVMVNVAVEIPLEEVLIPGNEDNDGLVTITPKGMSLAMEVIRKAIATSYVDD